MKHDDDVDKSRGYFGEVGKGDFEWGLRTRNF